MIAFRELEGTKNLFSINFKGLKKGFLQVPTLAELAITQSFFVLIMEFLGISIKRVGGKYIVIVHDSQNYPCMQKISSLALKIGIL